MSSNTDSVDILNGFESFYKLCQRVNHRSLSGMDHEFADDDDLVNRLLVHVQYVLFNVWNSDEIFRFDNAKSMIIAMIDQMQKQIIVSKMQNRKQDLTELEAELKTVEENIRANTNEVTERFWRGLSKPVVAPPA